VTEKEGWLVPPPKTGHPTESQKPQEQFQCLDEH
jgi:hypothetical protein